MTPSLSTTWTTDVNRRAPMLRLLSLLAPALAWRFGAFIDGGSEGSRIYVLRWRPAVDPRKEIICPEVVGDYSPLV